MQGAGRTAASSSHVDLPGRRAFRLRTVDVVLKDGGLVDGREVAARRVRHPSIATNAGEGERKGYLPPGKHIQKRCLSAGTVPTIQIAMSAHHFFKGGGLKRAIRALGARCRCLEELSRAASARQGGCGRNSQEDQLPLDGLASPTERHRKLLLAGAGRLRSDISRLPEFAKASDVGDKEDGGRVRRRRGGGAGVSSGSDRNGGSCSIPVGIGMVVRRNSPERKRAFSLEIGNCLLRRGCGFVCNRA